ncbi:GatB/YqeY domain-containing protein [Tenacibaculum sp. UWU-22]|uniref:GatB/YqeY domain-containing protein n=1 Tax=Tenacibaculum sp. UWU-22 TaxID=3234187 RepID=UPI0034DB61F9
MSLEKQVIDQIKTAMKAKDTISLTALRALKSAFMLAKTEAGATNTLSLEQELKIVQKQVKQRKDSADIFIKQGRQDLAEPELKEAAVLEQFLPEALSEEKIEEVVKSAIAKIGASRVSDMGKVMGVVSKELAGKADGKTIATIVRKNLL